MFNVWINRREKERKKGKIPENIIIYYLYLEIVNINKRVGEKKNIFFTTVHLIDRKKREKNKNIN